MAYPYHYLFSFGGTLLEGKEIWTNNIRFVATGTPEEEYDQQAILERLMPVMRTRIAAAAPAQLGYSFGTQLLWGKFNAIGPDGKYASGTETNRVDLASPGVTGGNSPHSYAPQLSLAVSWGTRRQRGRASKGRIFIPMPVVEPGINGHIPAADRQRVADAWAACLDELNDVAQDVGASRPIAAVVSGVDGSWEPISTVRVGSVLDTQRRRRNALVEAYSSAAVPDSE